MNRITTLLTIAGVLAVAAEAQPRRITLSGHIHPRARAENDQGRVSPLLQLPYVTVTLAQSPAQQAALDKLLAEQQTPGSPNYHHWITPEEYAQRFGASQADVDKVSAWLKSQGLTVAAVGRGRNWIAVSGQAAQIETAFQTELHRYSVNGESHYANAGAPSVPAEIAGFVRTIHGLSDFRLKPGKRVMTPAYTSAGGHHYLSPDDLATIYNINPLYSSGIDGSGQKLVVAGQTQVNLSDIRTFRTNYGLPAQDPQTLLVPGSRDPGVSSSDVGEADLDLEWAGAVARNASITYVYAYDVINAIEYAIDQDLAPVISSSYGSCEPETPSSEVATLRSFARQANAEGITWISSSGDAGGADCDDSQYPGLSVDVPSSIPEVTAMGGTEFQEAGETYWNATNGSTQASVRSYIPEVVWNDSAIDGSPSAGGGGVSTYFTKPSWQVGPGVPNDNARHVPDVSLNASADHDGYLVYSGGSLQVYGGTSVPAPVFSGMATLLNQYLVANGSQPAPGLGNMNPELYALAQAAPEAFHDITSGDNIVTVSCGTRFRVCNSSPVGYSAGVGYDNASGLGSVDAYNLVTLWGSSGGSPSSQTTLTLISNLSSFGQPDTVFLTATAIGPSGTTPAGTVQFDEGGTVLGSAALTGSAGVATATLALNGTQLRLGSQTINATYVNGSVNSSASVTVTVNSSSSAPGSPSIAGLTNGASYTQTYAPGMILSVFGSQLAPSPEAASAVPLPVAMAGAAATINGQIAPLYYVSQTQLNIQIPYETAPGTATLVVNNGGQVTSQSFTVSAAAPGIFGDVSRTIVPVGTATRGQITTLYMTGAGAVMPAVATGYAPAAGTALSNLPLPAQNTTLSIGNQPAAIEFIGIPYGLVGVVQVNFEVPTTIGVGTQPVVLSVGGVQSAAAQIVITN